MIIQLRTDGLELARRVHGPEHPAFVQALHDYALSLYDAGQYTESLEALQREKELIKQGSGIANMQQEAESHLAIGNCLLAMQEPAQALSQYEMSRAILQQIHPHPHQHPDFIAVLMNSGLAMQQCNRHQEALSLYSRALRQAEDVLGKCAVDIIMSYC